MIKVIDTETKSGIKIEICGIPFQWRCSLGKDNGDFTVKRGRNAGKITKGIKFNYSTCFYHTNLKNLLHEAQQRISVEYGMPVDKQNIEGMAGWERAIKEEEKLVQISTMVQEAYGKFFEKHSAAVLKLANTLKEEEEPESED